MSEKFSEDQDSALTIRSATNADGEAVRALVFGVLKEFGLEPERDGIDADLDDIEANYLDRGGLFEVLEDGEGELAGTVGLYPLGSGEAELRKMYFVKDIRGKGIGRKLLRRTIGRAKELGFSRVVLETASVLKAAIALYTSFGFREIEGGHAERCDKSFYLDLDLELESEKKRDEY